MQKKTRGFAPLIVLIVILALALGGYGLYKSKSAKSENKKTDQAATTNTEKDKIITAIMHRHSVFASKDAAKIRALYKEPEMAKQINALSDDSLLKLVAIVNNNQATVAELNSGSAVWTIGPTTASVKIKRSNGATIEEQAYKTNGQWW